MKFQGSIVIHKSREIVAACFINPDHNKEYQDGFVKKELISGIATQAEAISKLYYKYGKRDLVLTETILKNDLPRYFEAFYHHKHMDNTMKCTFVEIGPESTEYTYEFEYTRMSWILPKLMAILFPGMYRKQGEKWIKQFKEFVENQ